MRPILSLMCGTVGACLITAAGLVSVIFAAMGQAGELAAAAFLLAGWGAGFGIAFVGLAVLGHVTGVIESPSNSTGGTDA